MKSARALNGLTLMNARNNLAVKMLHHFTIEFRFTRRAKRNRKIEIEHQ
jgi:hypothetical protein